MFLYFNQNVPGKKFAGMEVGKRVQICTHIHEDFYGQYHAPWTPYKTSSIKVKNDIYEFFLPLRQYQIFLFKDGGKFEIIVHSSQKSWRGY